MPPRAPQCRRSRQGHPHRLESACRTTTTRRRKRTGRAAWSLPRELHIKDGSCSRPPFPALKSSATAKLPPTAPPPACEILVNRGAGPTLRLRTLILTSTPSRRYRRPRLHYDAASKTCTIDRTGLNKRFNMAVSEVLDMPLENPLRSLRVFVDRSSTEYFVNDGEAIFTTPLLPRNGGIPLHRHRRSRC